MCLSSVKDIRLSKYWVSLSVVDAERLWTWTPGNMMQVYLCPCFCYGPETKPGNLLRWLVNYSPGDVSVPVILDPHGTLSQPETIAGLKARPQHLADVCLRILVAGSQSFSLEATWNPLTPPLTLGSHPESLQLFAATAPTWLTLYTGHYVAAENIHL